MARLEGEVSTAKAALKKLDAEHADWKRELEELRAVKKDQTTKIKQLQREVDDLNQARRAGLWSLVLASDNRLAQGGADQAARVPQAAGGHQRRRCEAWW